MDRFNWWLNLSRLKKTIIIAAVLVSITLVGFTTYLLLSKKSLPFASPLTTTNTSVSRFPQPTPVAGEYNILLLGQGGAGHPGGILSDSMTVARLNTQTKTASLIFIPRDLWVNGMKINEVYSKGGLDSAKETVGAITGLSIKYGVVMDFPQFVQMIDSLGGIDIQVSKTFDDYYYPVQGKELETCGKSGDEITKLSATMSGFTLESQFPCRYEHIHFDAGKNHVNGATALKFARSRHSAQDSDDFGRGARQQVILLGIKDKLLTLDALNNIDKFFNSLSKLVKTDLDLATVKAVAALITSPNEYKISQFVPSTTNVLTSSRSSQGQSILLPKAGDGNWQDFQKFLKE